MKLYYASYVETGTNERITTDGYPTLEQAKTAAYGKAYAPKYGTVHFYTTETKEQN